MPKRRCKQCKEYVEEFIKVPAGVFCSYDHAIEFANSKQQATREKAARKKLRADKQRIKTKGDWMREAQAAFNKFIRLRDSNDPSISCQRHHQGQYHAGHYRSVGAHPELRFSELNNNKQCAPCNNHLSGNLVDYRINLIKKIGIEQVEWIEGPHDAARLSIGDIMSIKAKYKLKVKQLLS